MGRDFLLFSARFLEPTGESQLPLIFEISLASFTGAAYFFGDSIAILGGDWEFSFPISVVVFAPQRFWRPGGFRRSFRLFLGRESSELISFFYYEYLERSDSVLRCWQRSGWPMAKLIE